MATQQISSALRAPASSPPYPKANPGYGKRSVPDQRPRQADDFVFLPDRERHIAGYVDRLPDGAAMDIKSLAKSLPPYGQMAVGSALRALGVAGHLRHVRCLAAVGDGQVRWVTRTYWSRTARDNEWWSIHLRAEPAPDPQPVTVPQQRAPEPEAEPAQAPEPAPAPEGPSAAYRALAQLGRTEPRLALSAADCAALEEPAAAWLARGVNAEYVVRTLTAGLPAAVDSPVGFLRRRLRDKIPPQLHSAPGPEAPVRRLMVECTECGAPGHPEALPDGLCRSCRPPAPDAPQGAAPTAEHDAVAHVRTLRTLLRSP
ncbi:MarR family transcriptional regulator [Streptomyces sp. NPDC058637]|uniref:MarR family transcriptional regulator n=1 Tax=Streptomyces sp. NPDC058637 TaxID=3346569 RepID=UPI0036632D4E